MVSTEYHLPTELEEATRLLKKWKGRACVVAGGTNVIPDMRAGKIRPEHLLDISRIGELHGIKKTRARISVGALTSISQLIDSPLIEKEAGLLHRACHQLGNPLVRNRATIAGNLGNASPAADTAVPLLALNASVKIRGHDSQRTAPLTVFFVGPNQTVLKDDEIIVSVEFPRPTAQERTAYFKLGLRNAMAISVASVAVRLEVNGDRFSLVRIALGAVAPTPIRAGETEAFLEGQEASPAVINGAIKRVAQEVNPISDIRGSAEYRRYVSQVLVRRAIQQALGP